MTHKNNILQKKLTEEDLTNFYQTSTEIEWEIAKLYLHTLLIDQYDITDNQLGFDQEDIIEYAAFIGSQYIQKQKVNRQQYLQDILKDNGRKKLIIILEQLEKKAKDKNINFQQRLTENIQSIVPIFQPYNSKHAVGCFSVVMHLLDIDNHTLKKRQRKYFDMDNLIDYSLL